ncbi:cupin-like domain-containing protein [Psychroflexus sp. CAK57W]|uniref:cupin-like domain-containing protein n=1 Tax=Psychroflexus curvus TaxID=2873595 RepID=UPI001CCFB694|nr:cupin-like domain-containing protein [Psychroflexus curvus]MBZ9626957.1 cupin-like domain-containing protein [Psychroflexus curvus]MBZ9786950.1 cupin-like domain-containing protein [Psychroflexus curvus]
MTHNQKQKLNLQTVDRVKTISPQEFIEKYVKPQRPVVIEQLTQDWPAYEKWSLSYLKDIAGDVEVPLYENRPVSAKDKFNEPHAQMKLKDYVDLLKKGPTRYRIFLFNMMKVVPELQQHFKMPNLGVKFMKKLPFLFFGAENSSVFMHYDIDFANILHIHFEGKKRCIIYPPSETKFLYKVPNALISLNEIDFNNPDLEKFPALKLAKGYEAYLEHGEALYMPEGYWHNMTYLTPGFSMSLRTLPRSAKNLGKAFYNLTIMRGVENMMRKLKGDRWIEHKNKLAYRRQEKRLKKELHRE